jgi:hypothetical protein
MTHHPLEVFVIRAVINVVAGAMEVGSSLEIVQKPCKSMAISFGLLSLYIPLPARNERRGRVRAEPEV